MITSRDIIFLWVSRMVMLGLRFTGKLPFETVFITPLVFDIQGRKMSKSLGNAIDPMTELVPKYGADGTRFGILRQMRLESQELRFDERYCDEAKRFGTKLWNALRYTHALEEGLPRAGVLPPPDELTLADKWILTELRRCVETVTNAYDGFEFGVAADALLQFGWYTLCDWYVEATKAPSQRASRAAVLSFALNAFVRAMHPIAPFVTEEIWLTLPHDGATIVTASWPDAAELPAFPAEAETFRAVIEKVEQLRNARGEWALAPKETLRVEIPAALAGETGVVEAIATLARAEIATYDAARDGDARASAGPTAAAAPPHRRYPRGGGHGQAARALHARGRAAGVRGRALGEEARQRELRRARRRPTWWRRSARSWRSTGASCSATATRSRRSRERRQRAERSPGAAAEQLARARQRLPRLRARGSARVPGRLPRLLFVPYALHHHDAYTAVVREAFVAMGIELVGLHELPDPLAAVAQAPALFVGGGNTFRLLRALQERALLEPIRARVARGELRYLARARAPTSPRRPSAPPTTCRSCSRGDLGALGLVPFQFNPHYVDAEPGSTHMGETRAQRIEEFHEENDVPVLGLREGAWLRRRGAELHLGGVAGAILFRRGSAPAAREPNTDLSFLLDVPTRYDHPL